MLWRRRKEAVPLPARLHAAPLGPRLWRWWPGHCVEILPVLDCTLPLHYASYGSSSPHIASLTQSLQQSCQDAAIPGAVSTGSAVDR